MGGDGRRVAATLQKLPQGLLALLNHCTTDTGATAGGRGQGAGGRGQWAGGSAVHSQTQTRKRKRQAGKHCQAGCTRTLTSSCNTEELSSTHASRTRGTLVEQPVLAGQLELEHTLDLWGGLQLYGAGGAWVGG